MEEIIPTHYYKAEHLKGRYNEKPWILYKLRDLSLAQQKRACEGYSKIYQEQGRSEANNRLREFVIKCKEVSQGITRQPPRCKE